MGINVFVAFATCECGMAAVQVGGGCASVAVTATVHGVRLVVQRRNIEEEWDQVMTSDDP